MLTQTSVTAVRLLMHLVRNPGGGAASLKHIADDLKESPTYLTKIARHLVRAGVLRAQRGPSGGVVLNRAPQDITLLVIVEACQGTVHGDFCQEMADFTKACAIHQAGAELHQAILGVLSKWTLADFVARPCPAKEYLGKVHCLLLGGRPGLLLPDKKGKR